MQIIPAIDIIGGKCVRLTKGDFALKSVYEIEPIEIAKRFAKCGVSKLHLVDLDGAKSKKLVNLATIEAICKAVPIPVEVGGGIRTKEDLQKLFSVGVSQVVFGSLAVTDSERLAQFISEYGSEKIIIGIDLLNGEPRISGWTEKSYKSAGDLITRMLDIGVQTMIITDIDCDGTLSSPNFNLYRKLTRQFPQINMIASGGVSNISDLNELQKIGVQGVIIGKSLYEGKISTEQLSTFINRSSC